MIEMKDLTIERLEKGDKIKISCFFAGAVEVIDVERLIEARVDVENELGAIEEDLKARTMRKLYGDDPLPQGRYDASTKCAD